MPIVKQDILFPKETKNKYKKVDNIETWIACMVYHNEFQELNILGCNAIYGYSNITPRLESSGVF